MKLKLQKDAFIIDLENDNFRTAFDVKITFADTQSFVQDLKTHQNNIIMTLLEEALKVLLCLLHFLRKTFI